VVSDDTAGALRIALAAGRHALKAVRFRGRRHAALARFSNASEKPSTFNRLKKPPVIESMLLALDEMPC
jgi:hypothetical protein